MANSTHKNQNCGLKKIVLGGPKRGKKGVSIGTNHLSQSGFCTYQSEKSAGSDFNSHKGKGMDKKRKGKKSAYPQSGFSVSEISSE